MMSNGKSFGGLDIKRPLTSVFPLNCCLISILALKTDGNCQSGDSGDFEGCKMDHGDERQSSRSSIMSEAWPVR